MGDFPTSELRESRKGFVSYHDGEKKRLKEERKKAIAACKKRYELWIKDNSTVQDYANNLKNQYRSFNYNDGYHTGDYERLESAKAYALNQLTDTEMEQVYKQISNHHAETVKNEGIMLVDDYSATILNHKTLAIQKILQEHRDIVNTEVETRRSKLSIANSLWVYTFPGLFLYILSYFFSSEHCYNGWKIGLLGQCSSPSWISITTFITVVPFFAALVYRLLIDELTARKHNKVILTSHYSTINAVDNI